MSLSEKELEGCGPEAGAAAEAADVRPTQEDVAGLREAIARLAADNAERYRDRICTLYKPGGRSTPIVHAQRRLIISKRYLGQE